MDEKILQLNISTFLIYTKIEKEVFVTCIENEEKKEKQLTLTDLTYLTMENKFTAIFDNNIITSNLPLYYDIVQEFNKIDIDFKSAVGPEDKEYSKFLKTNWKNKGNAIKLSDIRKLYLIENS